MKSFQSLTTYVATAALVLGMTSGCGSTEAGSDKDDPVKIGGIVFQTGPLGTYGAGAVRGLESGVAYVNSHGGVLDGRKLKLDITDTASEGTQAIAAVRKYANDKDVTGIVGPAGTPELLAVAPLAKSVKLPIVTMGSATVQPEDLFSDNLFRVSLVQTPEVMKTFIDKAIEKNDLEKLSILFDRTNDQSVAEGKSANEISKNSGLKVTAMQSFSSTDTSVDSQVNRALSGGPDAVWVSGTAPGNAQVMRTLRARGFEGRILGGATLQVPEVADIAGKAAVGLQTFQAFNLTSKSPLVRDFVALQEKMFPKETIGSYTVYGFDTVRLLADAINRAGSTDRAKVVSAMGKTKDFETVQGPYSFDGGGDNESVVVTYSELRSDGTFEGLE